MKDERNLRPRTFHFLSLVRLFWLPIPIKKLANCQATALRAREESMSEREVYKAEGDW